MSSARSRLRRLALLLIPAAALGGVTSYFLWPNAGDVRLRQFVHARPPVPIVFTSRTNIASLQAAADEGEGFAYPGRGLWQADEGRLRLLKPDGTVHELTWGKRLPDGSTLIDVMSPSVSNDGKRIYFAGRKAPPDPGRFRLYSINVDGSDLRQLTGGPDDPGCVALPPMRYRSESDHSLIPDDERKRIDYDDVDPVELHFQESTRLAFASSRTPDFGRNSIRRSTNIWELRLDTGAKRPLTANRSNDRWPFLLGDNFIVFSMWSKNQEVIAPDERDIVPWTEGMKSPRPPCDKWMAAFLQPVGGQFGALVKPGPRVLRPRPLFNGRIVFQNGTDYADVRQQVPYFTVAQAEPGLLMNSPSATLGDARSGRSLLKLVPDVWATAVTFAMGTPSPCPGGKVVMAGGPVPISEYVEASHVNYGPLGIWICDDDWDYPRVSGQHLLFDDPNLIDAEPVAAYARHFDRYMDATETPPAGTPSVTLANGSRYTGPSGTMFGSSLYINQHADAPGQLFPDRKEPFFIAPPNGSLDHIRVYASHRDRFDDPAKPRIDGQWELLLKAPVKGETFGAQVPAGVPTVLAGFDKNGRVLSWSHNPRGESDPERIFAFAGDHYSAAKPGGKHFCIGCHPGHSGLATSDHRHQERQQ